MLGVRSQSVGFEKRSVCGLICAFGEMLRMSYCQKRQMSSRATSSNYNLIAINPHAYTFHFPRESLPNPSLNILHVLLLLSKGRLRQQTIIDTADNKAVEEEFIEQRTAVIGTVNARPSTAGNIKCYWEWVGFRVGRQIYVNSKLVLKTFIRIGFEGGDGRGSSWRSGEAHSFGDVKLMQSSARE
jgi:hypothetical protein